jgi:hypothetical protein
MTKILFELRHIQRHPHPLLNALVIG